jgi:polysaccharide deacetylase family protein (PEP-CTERM system associated)
VTQHLLSFDIEEWFQVPFVEGYIEKGQWTRLNATVEDGTSRILSLLDRHSTKATFFVVGWIAEQYPTLVREIIKRGHEVACHGYDHITVDRMSRETFRIDLKRAREAIFAVAGRIPHGYRAPLASIGEKNRWALLEIRDAGFLYDSSIYRTNPFVHSGLKDVGPKPYEIERGLIFDGFVGIRDPLREAAELHARAEIDQLRHAPLARSWAHSGRSSTLTASNPAAHRCAALAACSRCSA